MAAFWVIDSYKNQESGCGDEDSVLHVHTCLRYVYSIECPEKYVAWDEWLFNSESIEEYKKSYK